MHAARALNAQRKKRADHRLANVRRLSAASGSRTPISSADLERLEQAAKRINRRNTGGVNCAYVGFTLAIFGSIPLIVGTFVEVPALWEVGLTITIVGLMLGIVYWCMDFMRETKGVGPVIPKPKPQIPIGRMQNLSSKSKPPICLSTLEKDEVITVEVPAAPSAVPTIITTNNQNHYHPHYHHHQKNRSHSEPILEHESKQLLQRREPKPFLEFEHEEELKDYLEHEEEEIESKQVSETKQEIELKEQDEASPTEIKSESLLEVQKEIEEPEVLLTSKSSEETKAEAIEDESKPEPESSVEKESNQIPDVETLQSLLDSIDRDSPLLAPPPNDTAVQIIPESSHAEQQLTSAEEPIVSPARLRVSEEKEIVQSDLSPVDCEATPPNHPVASSPPPTNPVLSVPNASYSNAIESEFPSVPGVVPDEPIQMVEVVPSLTNDTAVEKKAEEAANE